MGAEAVVGKNFITGEEYSDGQRGFILATLGGGSLLGKVISKINIGKVSNEEIASVEKNSGVTLSMNGAEEFDNLFKKITKDVVDDSKTVVEGAGKANKYCLGGEEHYESLKDLFGADNVEWTSKTTISSTERNKTIIVQKYLNNFTTE